MKDRMEMLVSLSELLKSFGLSLNMTVVYGNKSKIKPYKNTPIQFRKRETRLKLLCWRVWPPIF